MGSDESHFSVSLIARDSVHSPQLLKRKESRCGFEPRSLCFTNLSNALPLGKPAHRQRWHVKYLARLTLRHAHWCCHHFELQTSIRHKVYSQLGWKGKIGASTSYSVTDKQVDTPPVEIMSRAASRSSALVESLYRSRPQPQNRSPRLESNYSLRMQAVWVTSLSYETVWEGRKKRRRRRRGLKHTKKKKKKRKKGEKKKKKKKEGF